MKKAVFLLLSMLFVIGFISCSDDTEDASVLVGIWRSVGEPEIEVVSNNEEVVELIKRDVKRMASSSQLEFRANGEFGQTNYDDNGTQTSYFSGPYYKENGKLYGKFYVSGTFNVSTIFLYVSENNRLTVSLNAMNFYNDRTTLHIIGVEDPTGINISSVSIKYNFESFTGGQGEMSFY